jgi:hypothetical protein
LLKSLKFTNVGPAPRLAFEFAPRLNLLTGDNGLGKSFVLDSAWWALTRKWAAEVNPKLLSGLMARPRKGANASIEFSLQGKTRALSYLSRFDRQAQAWTGQPGRPANPGLVIYAMVDGSFAVWDPARNYWKKRGTVDVQDRPSAYVFSPGEVWNSLPGNERQPLCQGLIVDWAGWQKEQGKSFQLLRSALKALSPSPNEVIEPGELTRISLDDSRDYPTLRLPYDAGVPVVQASAGVRRMIALAYLLIWTWQEHERASELLEQPVTSQITFLIDEIEAHLHPKWQRRITGALLEVVSGLRPDASVQLITATHSPLVMASVETLFDPGQDAWFDLDLIQDGASRGARTELTKRPFVRLGDASRWLMSDAFDLETARSLDAERVLREASSAMSRESFGKREARELDGKLREVLSETDPFWMRWRHVADRKGWL